MRRLCALAEISLPEYAFPLILKTGYNHSQKLVRYYFNYSSSPISFTYDGCTGRNLLTGKEIAPGTQAEISPWDVLIVEDCYLRNIDKSPSA